MGYIYTPAGDTLPQNFPTEGGGGGGGGSTNYNDLSNKPIINGVVLQGSKTSAQLSIPSQSAVQAASENAANALLKAEEAKVKAEEANTTSEDLDDRVDALTTKINVMPDTAIDNTDLEDLWQ